MEFPPLEDFRGENLFELKSSGFSNIKVYTPSIELLACAKIFSTRGKDLKDLKETAILDVCDLPKLKQFIDEYTSYMINPDNPEYNLHQIEAILLEKGLSFDEKVGATDE